MNEFAQYKRLMRKCINLAKKGEGRVSPNPLVGAVIFDDDFNIVSQGYHEKYGENHAERNAILNSRGSVRGMNIAVNLEPCCHFGKTPPCADLIIESGIKKVIIGMKDPNPIVSGKGIKKLEEAGIEVIKGILEKDCLELNEIFVKNQTRKAPFVMIKSAITLDGKIATKTGNSKYITDEYSRKEVHKLRNKYDAILTSSKTVIADNPLMTCRIKGGRNPIRIIADPMLKTPPESNVYQDDSTRVLLVCSKENERSAREKYPKNVEIIPVPLKNKHIDIEFLLKNLYEKGINSIMTEAGGIMNNALLRENLADKMIVFIAPKVLCDTSGISFLSGEERILISECNELKFTFLKKLKNDIMLTADVKAGRKEIERNNE